MPTIAAITDQAIALAVDRFFQQPEIRGNLEFLSHRLPGSAEIFIVGGALRNIVIFALHGNAPPTGDIDIFIGGLPRNFSLSELLSDQTVKPTDLKGVRWYPVSSGLVYDLCLLPDFVVIATYHLDPTMENLLSSIDFTVNAILYDLHNRRLFENGCIVAVDDRVIDFNCLLFPDKRLIAYRLLLMSHKTGFKLSERVFQFAKNRLELETVVHLKRLFQAKVGKARATAIMGEYDDLCKCPSYGDYLADWV